jgi:hypothetical protein
MHALTRAGDQRLGFRKAVAGAGHLTSNADLQFIAIEHRSANVYNLLKKSFFKSRSS